MTKIIGVAFKKQRGKDSFCNFVKNFLQIHCPNCVVKKIGFANKLKDIAFQLYGWSGLQRGVYYEDHYTDKEIILPKINLTPRSIWIRLGNKMREIYSDTWVDFVLKQQNVDVLLVNDLGFRNEATAIREAGGILIRIDREGPIAFDDREIQLDDWHDWDAIISNHGTLYELNEKAEKIAKEYIL